jgi:hypothetical protein
VRGPRQPPGGAAGTSRLSRAHQVGDRPSAEPATTGPEARHPKIARAYRRLRLRPARLDSHRASASCRVSRGLPSRYLEVPVVLPTTGPAGWSRAAWIPRPWSLKTISELLGHASIEVTADVYLHSLDVQVNCPGSDGGSGVPWVQWSRITGSRALQRRRFWQVASARTRVL